MPIKFNPDDQTTWPPLDQSVLWAYHYKGEEQYIVANIEVWSPPRKFWLNPQGVGGYEYEADVWDCIPFAWQPIPSFNMEQSNG